MVLHPLHEAALRAELLRFGQRQLPLATALDAVHLGIGYQFSSLSGGDGE